MKETAKLSLILFIAVSQTFCSTSDSSDSTPETPSPSANISQFQWIKDMMDKYHKTFDVYTDAGSGGNHFPVMAKMWGYGSYDMIEMDECFADARQLHQNSATYIKATFRPQSGNSWGGFYFMNGIFLSNTEEPQQNWGDCTNAGFNLIGATKLTFFARGEKGGEQVEFFVGGIGWPDKPYRESLPKISTGYVTLSKEWKQYTIDLTGKDLSYVLSGFGWVTNAPRNLGQEITFYIDDIRFDLERPDDLRFIASYEKLPHAKK